MWHELLSLCWKADSFAESLIITRLSLIQSTQLQSAGKQAKHVRSLQYNIWRIPKTHKTERNNLNHCIYGYEWTEDKEMLYYHKNTLIFFDAPQSSVHKYISTTGSIHNELLSKEDILRNVPGVLVGLVTNVLKNIVFCKKQTHMQF